MNVVVLGGTRFIGRALVRELRARDHRVLVVHRGEHEPGGDDGAEHFHCNRRTLGDHAGALARFGADAWVDLCAMTGPDAEAALRAAPPRARLVVASSMDVYRAFGALWTDAGNVTESDPVPLDEASPLRAVRPPPRPSSPSGWDFDPAGYEKLDVERAYLARGAAVCRLPMVYGEHDYQRREEFVLSRVRAGRGRIPVGPGTFLWSRGYVGDVARGIARALACDAAVGRVFNLGERRTLSIRGWVERILLAAGARAELVTVREESLPDDLAITGALRQHLLVDTALAREILGYTDTDPDECLARSVGWHLEHPPTDTRLDFSADDRALAGG